MRYNLTPTRRRTLDETKRSFATLSDARWRGVPRIVDEDGNHNPYLQVCSSHPDRRLDGYTLLVPESDLRPVA